MGSFRKDKHVVSEHVAKLETVGLFLEDHPHIKESEGNFKMNMTVWPPLEYGHIVNYFISVT